MSSRTPILIKGAAARKGVGLVVLLVAAMVASTLLQGSLGVLSIFIIDEFDITRSLFGLAFAAFSLVGGFSSLYMGVLADRDSRRTLIGLFTLAGLGLIGAAIAPTYMLLLGAMVLGGLALGAGNPVTNRIIAENVSPPRRGPVIGLKQSGPPLAIFLAGLLLPPIAIAAGWRFAVGVIVVLPIAGLIATFAVISSDRRTTPLAGRVSDLDPTVRFVVRWLTLIGVGVAIANSGLIAFLPLYTHEDLGLSTTTAGIVAAAMGLAGVVGRIVWGSIGGRFERPTSALLIIAAFSVVSVLCVTLSSGFGVGWLWAGAIIGGGSILSWHAVAWLVIIDRVDVAAVGKASGIMHMGSTLGFAVGAPLTGLALDVTDSYALTWSLIAVVMVVVAAITGWFRIRASHRRSAAAHPSR